MRACDDEALQQFGRAVAPLLARGRLGLLPLRVQGHLAPLRGRVGSLEHDRRAARTVEPQHVLLVLPPRDVVAAAARVALAPLAAQAQVAQRLDRRGRRGEGALRHDHDAEAALLARLEGGGAEHERRVRGEGVLVLLVHRVRLHLAVLHVRRAVDHVIALDLLRVVQHLAHHARLAAHDVHADLHVVLGPALVAAPVGRAAHLRVGLHQQEVRVCALGRLQRVLWVGPP
mmetsp:Transcript_24481/g.62169  ORF Transcript_24481/g.62169 Transcript_24481/m.62169 type:complete len:230 (-) Transcript_24481:1243-1932(-)